MLTPRQVEVLQFVADGRCRKQAPELMGISPLTMKAHLSRIYERIGVKDNAMAVAYGFRNGLLR